MTERDIDCRIEELLTRMGLWERRKEPVVKWSRGMKQKLAIARAVLHRPDLGRSTERMNERVVGIPEI